MRAMRSSKGMFCELVKSFSEIMLTKIVNVGRGANIKKDPQRSAGQNRWVKKKITSWRPAS
jgi:hypothetical protein